MFTVMAVKELKIINWWQKREAIIFNFYGNRGTIIIFYGNEQILSTYILLLPLSLNKSISKFILGQTFKNLTKFIEKSTKS
jgi:hypothetical protein